MTYMFLYASAFNQDLGWCVNDDLYVHNAFTDTECESTSCGVEQGVEQVDGACALSPAPTRAPPHSPALLIFFILIPFLMPFLIFLSCIYLFWWLVSSRIQQIRDTESGRVAPMAVDAVPATSEEPAAPATSEELAPTAVDAAPATSAAPPTAEEQAPAALMGTVVAVHEGESMVPYATVLSVEQ